MYVLHRFRGTGKALTRRDKDEEVPGLCLTEWPNTADVGIFLHAWHEDTATGEGEGGCLGVQLRNPSLQGLRGAGRTLENDRASFLHCQRDTVGIRGRRVGPVNPPQELCGLEKRSSISLQFHY